MSTTIQLKKQTKQKLEVLKQQYEKRINKKLTFDEFINLLIEKTDKSYENRLKRINSIFGIIKPSHKELVGLRTEEEKRLEVISRKHR